jgi:glycosyltransferase involved in cell wall biosynthesis
VDEDAEDTPADSAKLVQPDNAPDLPKEAFIVRWSGSYNTWADTKTLLAGLNRAMESNRNIYFLSTGGGTKGYNEKVYDEFVASVAESKFRERFILRGWVPNNEVPYWNSQSHLGLNVDRFTYEGVLGSRNRVIRFLQAGVPVLTTELSELTKVLSHKGLVNAFKLGDPQDLSKQILSLAENREFLKEQFQKGREFVVREYGFGMTLRPCQEWLERALAAPDNAERSGRSKECKEPKSIFLNESEHWTNFELLREEMNFLKEEKSRLDRLRGSILYKLLRGLKRFFSK